MKLFGFDYFGLDLDNKFFNDLGNYLNSHLFIKNVFMSILLNIQLYFMACVVNKTEGKKLIIYIIKILPLTIIVRLLSIYLGGTLSFILEFVYMMLATSKFNYKKFPKAIFTNLFIIIYQMISLNTRSLHFKNHKYGVIASQILSIDLYLMLYLHKEMEVNIMGDDGTWFFFGFTAWLYRVAGFIVGLFTFHPMKKSRYLQKEKYE